MIKLCRKVEETNNVPNKWFLTAVSRHAKVLQDFVKCDVGQWARKEEHYRYV